MDEPKNFERLLNEISLMCEPQLWMFDLRYAQGMGWFCTVQESSFKEVNFAKGKSCLEAMENVLLLMKERSYA